MERKCYSFVVYIIPTITLLFLLCPRDVNADTINVSCVGEVYSALISGASGSSSSPSTVNGAFGINPPWPINDGPFSMSVNFIFDTSAPDQNPTDINYGVYSNAIQSMTVTLEGHNFIVPISGSTISISIRNDLQDVFILDTYGYINVLGRDIEIRTLGAMYANDEPDPYSVNTFYQNDALQPPPYNSLSINTPSIFQLSISGWRFDIGNGLLYDTDRGEIHGTMLSVYNPVTPVPEPSTMLLLGSGLVGLVGYGRRRMKR